MSIFHPSSYIGIPTDVTFKKIDASGLLVPLTTTLDPNNETLETKIVTEIQSRLEKSKSAVIIVDGGTVYAAGPVVGFTYANEFRCPTKPNPARGGRIDRRVRPAGVHHTDGKGSGQ